MVAAVREIPYAATIAKAIAVRAALGGGQDAAERGRVLADAILEREEVKLALEIREGGHMCFVGASSWPRWCSPWRMAGRAGEAGSTAGDKVADFVAGASRPRSTKKIA